MAIQRRKQAQKTPRHASQGIILIDQEPLRRGVAADCTTLMAELESVRIEWKRFDREDKPAFARWRAREFGPLLSESRDVEVQIRDAQALIHEVEMEMRRTIQSPQMAYQRVMFRRENPAAAEEEEEAEAAPSAAKPGQPQRLSEFEKEALFQEWVQKFLGTNPDKMDDAAYTKTFEVFKSHMFAAARQEPKTENVKRRAAVPQSRMEQNEKEHEQEHEQEKEREMAIDARVKELYRKLVRRLHPDLRADGSADVSALWHEVQEAYAASDVPRMEILIALSNIQEDELGEGTSLSQMRSVLRELQRSLRALEKSLREAEGEEAWNFARTGPTEDLRERVERQLKMDLAVRATHRDLLTRTIADWARGLVANRRAVFV